MSTQFWCGVCACVGWYFSLQDLLGLEGYIAMVRAHWFDTHWTVGFIVSVVFIVLALRDEQKGRN